MLRAVFFTLAFLTVAALSLGATWPGFRGPPSPGLSAENLPLTWSETDNLKWKITLQGFGQSSPVVWGNTVYVTTIEGAHCETCHVSAYDLATGNLLWRKSAPNPTTDVENTNYTSRGAPTPAASDSGLVVLFEGGLLESFAHDGTLQWQRNLKAEFGEVKTQFGLSSSPVQHQDLTFIWIERPENPFLMAIETATGKDRWKVPGLGKVSYSTPVLLEVAGETQLVCSADGVIRGFNPATGATLWTLEGVAGNSAPSPCIVGAGRFLMGGSAGPSEGGGSPADSNCLIEVKKNSDGTFAAGYVWKAARATSSFGSPIAHRGLVYFISRQGICYALDLETGAEVFAERTKEGLWATPLAVDDRIYIIGNNGWTTVLQAGREFKVLAENRLWPEAPAGGPGDFGGQAQYAVAAVPDAILIRSGEFVYCVAKK